MNKFIKTLGIIAAVLFFAILILELIGFRFDYEKVNNFVSNKKQSAIVADGWVFEYFTFPISNEKGKEIDEYIEGFSPIKKYAFLYKGFKLSEPAFVVYTADTNEYVGVLWQFEGKDKRHYFFEWAHGPEPAEFVKNWSQASNITINGKEHDLFKHSYFSTAESFTAFSFGTSELKLIPYKDDTYLNAAK